MADRPRFFDDLAGLAGTAFSAVTGAREELHSIIRTRVDEALGALELVRREEFEAVRELATRARIGQEDAERRLDAIEARLAELHAKTNEPAKTTENTDIAENQAGHPEN